MKWYEAPLVLEILVSGGMLAGISLSAMLWLSDRAYPLTPILFHGLVLPAPFDSWLVISLVTLGVISLVLPKDPRPMLGLILNLGVLLFLDQSRWQPWVYLYLFFFIGFYLIRRRNNEARTGSIHQVFRLMIIGVYVWSAIQKFNVSFITQVAPGLITNIPFIGTMLSASLLVIIAIPVVEFGIGLGLLFTKTRKPAVVFAILMHVLILLSIVPSESNWNTVVWPWNITMMLLVFSLFWNSHEPIHIQTLAKSKHPFIISVLAFFFILPVFSFTNLWDSYLSFALYSGNVKPGYLIMRPEHLKVFPEHVWPLAERQRDGSVRLRQLFWSMEVLNVPVYPEERIFKSGLAWACEETGDEIEMEIFERPHWITKERKVKTLSCLDL